jgi:hypothetical protein
MYKTKTSEEKKQQIKASATLGTHVRQCRGRAVVFACWNAKEDGVATTRRFSSCRRTQE